jgi:O-antigen/teichoic acid export membrane protein
VLPLLAFAMALRLTTIFLSPILSVGSSPKLLMITSLTTNGINFLALVICVPLYKLMGVGYAEIITSIGVVVTVIIIAHKTWIYRSKVVLIIN